MSYQDKKDLLKGLIQNAPATPVQKITPVKKQSYHLNLHIPHQLEIQVKTKAIHTGKSIKQIVIDALNQYLLEDNS